MIRQVLIYLSTVKTFKLIVVDTRPLNDGLQTLLSLSPKIECVYTSLSGAASCMKQATRVILGASCLMSNGAMLAPAGTAMIASLAKSQRVPVLVAAESYKFCEKVQLDSIVHNELGSADEISILASKVTDEIKQTIEMVPTPVIDSTYKGSAERNTNLPFAVINLRYDLTPMGNISVVATETGLIPPTSIPVLIRELRTDKNDNSNIED
jgi:translation initiation factor eIF-2B subunit delta